MLMVVMKFQINILFIIFKKNFFYIGTPIRIAAQNNDIEILRLLLEKNETDVNYQCRVGSPLLCAIQNNHIEIVKELLHSKNHQINVNLEGIFIIFFF